MKFEENGIRYMNMYDVWWDINIYIFIYCVRVGVVKL